MKNLFFTFLFCLLSFVIFGQSVSPQVIAASGSYFKNNNASLSWTLGEVSTETYTNGDVILTQGFQQAVSITITGIDMDLLVYLEGSYNGLDMNTNLNSGDQIPLDQPYNTAPWNYSGTESVSSIPNIDVVDWALIELREAASPSEAIPDTRIARQAALLLSDGCVVGLDGSSILQFGASYSQNLYVIVWHRNHLGIMSANAVTLSGGIHSYDFTTSGQAYNSGEKMLDGGVYGMYAGDVNADGSINNTDEIIWTAQAGTKGYLSADMNLDVQTDNKDKNDLWLENQGINSQVPE